MPRDDPFDTALLSVLAICLLAVGGYWIHANWWWISSIFYAGPPVPFEIFR